MDTFGTLSVFGVGRRTVGRGPGAGGRSPVAPTTTAGTLRAADGPPEAIRSVDDVATATKRRTTSRLTVCGAQLGISDRFPHPSNYFRSINSTSRRGPASQTEPRSTLAHLPGISHFPSPKWRLELLPVPVLTRNFDFRTQLPTKKWICSRLSPSLN